MRKPLSITFAAMVAMILSFNAKAEIAVLCGNLSSIQINEKNALVHADFDSDSIRSAQEVKFLLQRGIPQKVIAARTIKRGFGFIEVKTSSSLFVFKNIASCEPEGSVTVVINGMREWPCACYSD